VVEGARLEIVCRVKPIEGSNPSLSARYSILISLRYNKHMQDSIFTKIIKGEIPAHKVYEDKQTLAFLTINPIHPGHTLVVPKEQVDKVWDLSDETYQAVMATCKKVANRIQEVLQPVRVGVHVAGSEVPHAHVHLFPFTGENDFWDKPMEASVASEELTEMAARLRMEDEL
jgi:histidine triad (HIT) family protein